MSQIVFKPIVTEKSLDLQNSDKYSFWVPVSTTKGQIISAFKATFGITPLRIRSLIRKGKKKTDWKRRRSLYQSNLKRVIISLPKDKKLDIMAVKKS